MGDLTAVEAELVAAAEAGERLDLSRRTDRVVRAKAIRNLVRTADADPHGLMLHGAMITGQLDLSDLETNMSVQLTGCAFEQPLALFRCRVPWLALDHSVLPGLDAEGIRTQHFMMRHARSTGEVRLDGARVEGHLMLSGTSLRTGGEVALKADGLHVGRGAHMDGLFAESSNALGTVRMPECDLGSELILNDAVVINTRGSGVTLDSGTIASSLHLNGAYVRGTGTFGALVLIGARIGGQLSLSGTVLRGGTGAALCADRLKTEASAFIVDGFSADAGSAIGTVRLVDARIVAGLVLRDATVSNRLGQAFYANRLKVDASLNIGASTRFEGTGDAPVLDLSDMDIGSQLSLHGASITHRGGDGGVDLCLLRTVVGRSLVLPVDRLVAENTTVVADGLSYPDPPIGDGDWLTLLSRNVPAYEAQSYQQLAAVHRSAGHEREARRILIAQQDDLHERGSLGGWWTRLWHRVSGLTIGYGYQPSRAVAGLLVTFLLSLALVFFASQHGATTSAKDRPADACSSVNRVSLAADLAIPLVKLGGPPRCELSNTTSGQWFTAGGWLVQLLGWSFATLSVAGFTGLVRKT